MNQHTPEDKRHRELLIADLTIANKRIDQLMAALTISTNGLRHCARWNISEEKANALMAVVFENESILQAK